MKDTMLMVGITVALIIGVICFVLIINFFLYEYYINIGEANIVKVFVVGQKVYEGKKAFVDITSGGMTTTITIFRQLFPWEVTDKVYSNNDIKIEN